ncbi:unnamed protein product, partial [Phaeothamnion confervicola]
RKAKENVDEKATERGGNEGGDGGGGDDSGPKLCYHKLESHDISLLHLGLPIQPTLWP